MKTIAKLGLVPVAVLALACAGDKGSESLDSDLQRDLEMASGIGLELAAAQHTGHGIISPIEATGGTSIRPIPGPRRTPKAPPARVADPSAGTDPVDEPMSTITVANASVTDSIMTPAEVEVPEPGPIAVSRPTPATVNFPADGGGQGPGMSDAGVIVAGAVLGAILRGGTSGRVDVCERHPRRPRQPMIIDTRVPGMPVPIGGGSVPRQ